MTATLVISLVIGGLLLLGVLSILGLAMNLVGGIFELVFGLLGLVLGAIGTVVGLLVGGFAAVFAGGVVLLVLGALALPLLLPVLALAGIGSPQKFFATLREAGLDFEPCPQPDHARYDRLPWPPGTTVVLTTEKDAVKLPPALADATAVWVVPLDLALPAALVDALVARLSRSEGAPSPRPAAPTP